VFYVEAGESRAISTTHRSFRQAAAAWAAGVLDRCARYRYHGIV